jgi:hypothetical protein
MQTYYFEISLKIAFHDLKHAWRNGAGWLQFWGHHYSKYDKQAHLANYNGPGAKMQNGTIKVHKVAKLLMLGTG